MTNVKHWVEDLFPPRFTCRKEDLLATNNGKEIKISIFEELKKVFVSAEDIEKIENVFERVWMFKKMEQQQQKGCDSQAKSEEEIEEEDNAENKVEDSEIWNSSEMAVLRVAFNKTKEENIRLKSKLDFLQQLLSSTKASCNKRQNDFERQQIELSDAKKSNVRYSIVVSNCQKQLEKAHEVAVRQNSALEALNSRLLEANRQNSDLKEKLSAAEIKERSMELNLDKQQSEFLEDQAIREDHLKIEFDKKLFDMQQKLELLETKLSQEEEAHNRSKRGLEHLRNHFSSLPEKRADQTQVVSKIVIS